MIKLTSKRIGLVVAILMVLAFGTFYFAEAAQSNKKAQNSTEIDMRPGENNQSTEPTTAKLSQSSAQKASTEPQQAKTYQPSSESVSIEQKKVTMAQQSTTTTLNSELEPEKVQSIPILYYHSIATEAGNEVRMPPEKFQQQMSYLSEHGYHVISMDELYQLLYNNKPFPRKPIVITFDDGYSDNFTNAFPIMQKYGFTATVFMVSSYINEGGALSAEQLRALLSAGWIIGGHTENHTDLIKINSTQTITELQQSRKKIEAIVGKPLKYFAYPYGGHNTTIMNEVQNDGYSLAFTTEKGWISKNSNPLAIHRVYCYASMSMDEFARRISNPNY